MVLFLLKLMKNLELHEHIISRFMRKKKYNQGNIKPKGIEAEAKEWKTTLTKKKTIRIFRLVY